MAAASWTECTHSTPGRRMRRVERVPDDDEHRHAVAVRVVDRHRRMLQADRAVRKHAERLAFDLGVAVRHRDRGFFVAAGDELRLLVAAVVDDRFLQPAEAGAGIRADVFKVQRSKTSTMKSEPQCSVVRTSTSGGRGGFGSRILQGRFAAYGR